MKKKLLTLAVILLSGVFLAGCTLFGGDEETDDQASSEIENVEVIENEDDEADVEEIEKVDDESDEEEVEEVEEESEEEAEDEEEEEEESETTPEGAKTVGTATSAEGATVSGYQYNVQGGQLIFEWKVSANGDAYPKAAAQQGSDNSLIVIFPSLRADYVAEEEGTTDLGNMLPEVMFRPTGEGSEYKFLYSTEKSFELGTEDRGEEGRFVVLKVPM